MCLKWKTGTTQVDSHPKFKAFTEKAKTDKFIIRNISKNLWNLKARNNMTNTKELTKIVANAEFCLGQREQI